GELALPGRALEQLTGDLADESLGLGAGGAARVTPQRPLQQRPTRRPADEHGRPRRRGAARVVGHGCAALGRLPHRSPIASPASLDSAAPAVVPGARRGDARVMILPDGTLRIADFALRGLTGPQPGGGSLESRRTRPEPGANSGASWEEAMQIDDMIIVSVDDHVVEPPDLFERHLPARYQDLAPRVVHKDDGTDVWSFQGMEVPNIGLNAVAGRPPEEYGIDPTSFEEIREGCFDLEKRILDMNANGLLGSLCFPSLPGFAGRLFGSLEDKQAARILTEAYNDWHIDEWCGTFPGRFIPLAIPAIWDPEVTAAEIRRVAKKGCRAITFPENPVPLGLPSLHTDHWDPVWKACEDEGTVVCMHIGSSSQLAVTSMDAPFDVTILLQPMNIVQCAADLVYSPIWRKFPGVKIALSE